MQRRFRAAEVFQLVLVHLRHDLHQTLSAHGALGIRVEARFDGHHGEQQQRIEADFLAGRVRRTNEVTRHVAGHAVAASEVVGHGNLLARVQHLVRTRIRRHALVRDISGENGCRGHMLRRLGHHRRIGRRKLGIGSAIGALAGRIGRAGRRLEQRTHARRQIGAPCRSSPQRERTDHGNQTDRAGRIQSDTTAMPCKATPIAASRSHHCRTARTKRMDRGQ